MLAPVGEVDAQERDLLALGLESARRWPAFAAELEDVSGIDVGYRDCGSLLVAAGADDACALERDVELRGRLGLAVRPLVPSEARALEPALAPGLRAAAEVPGDHAVDPQLVGATLALAAERAGAVLRPDTAVTSVLVCGDAVAGVALAGGEQLPAARVVIAAGPWSGAIDGLPAAARVPVRPVKGQLLRLRDRAHDARAPLLERVVRHGRGYIVPRGDGRYVVGGTVEERGFDTAPTALAAYELLRDASEVVPGVLELEVEEHAVGLRPGTPDNAPVLGASVALDGLSWATGHHRNGVLLAPLTGELLAAELTGEQAIPAAFGSGRFAEALA
jgi:glycine oxidase